MTTLAMMCIALFVAGCGDANVIPGGANALSGSPELEKQSYAEGVNRALQQLGSAQAPDSFGKAVDTGNKRQLQASAIAWDQGVASLQQLDPPDDAVAANTKLLKAVQGLATWNKRLIAAAPNKQRVQALARQAAASPDSKAYGAAACELQGLGYNIGLAEACGGGSPLDSAGGPVQ